MTHSEITAPVSPPGEVTSVVEHFFRHEAGKMISTLTRIFGIEHLNLAEDVVRKPWPGRCRPGPITASREILRRGGEKSGAGSDPA